MLRVLFLYVLPFALAVYALIDCAQTPDAEVRNLPKPLWLVLVIVIMFLGPIAWLIAGRPRSLLPPAARGGRGPSAGPEGPRGPRGPRGPEDDPDFMRRV